MSNEVRPLASRPSGTHDIAVHATAVAIGDEAVLIRGPSRSGKSTLALALIAASEAVRRIVLIGDDRVLLAAAGTEVVASPHPRIAGLIERRGYGIVSMSYRVAVPVAVIVDLAPGAAEATAALWEDTVATCQAASFRASRCDLAGKNFPSLVFVNQRRWDARSAAVLAWFAATSAAHSGDKMLRRTIVVAKD